LIEARSATESKVRMAFSPLDSPNAALVSIVPLREHRLITGMFRLELRSGSHAYGILAQ
jgi:hypothetical protein